MPPGKLIVTGPLGAAKTLACEVLMSCGWDFGSRREIHHVSDEHEGVLQALGKICRVFDPDRHPIYARYNPELLPQALAVADTIDWWRFPEAFKNPFPAAQPVLNLVLQPRVVVWCVADFQKFAAHAKEEFHYTRMVEKVDLTECYRMAFINQRVASSTETVWFNMGIPAGSQITPFYLLHHRPDETEYNLGFSLERLNARLQALLKETGGRIGMKGVWAPDDPNNFPKLRRTP